MSDSITNMAACASGIDMTTRVRVLPRQILVEQFSIRTASCQGIDLPCDQERLGFFVCLSGEDRLTVQDTREVVHIRKGLCGAYHEPQGLSSTAVYGPNEPFGMLSITMPPETLEDVFAGNGDVLSELFPRKYKPKHQFSSQSYAYRFCPVQPLINTAVSQILNPPVDQDLFPAYLEGKVLEIISLMLQTLCKGDGRLNTCPSPGTMETAGLFQARALLEEDLETPPSPIEIAGLCGLSVDRMHRGFKRLFGRTISQHLRDCRMEKARQLLASGDCNVTDACFRVGYSNLSHFAKQYRHYFGHSPVKDRKRFFPAS